MRKLLVVFTIFGLGVLLAGGLFRLFSIRFSQGDVYPPYSSYRADGVGAKALHDSLVGIMPVQRNLKPVEQMGPGENAAFFLLGISSWRELYMDSEDIEKLTRDGNRVVIVFLPQSRNPVQHSDSAETTTAGKKTPKNSDEEEKKKEVEKKKIEKERFKTRWGVKEAYFEEAPEKAVSTVSDLEPRITWHSVLYFDDVDPAWRTLYTAKEKPVVIERTMDKGSVVLIADSFLFSNEGLDKERAPKFLSAMVGHAKKAIFDETHLGVNMNPGVASLMRKYRMHGIVIAFLITAFLFIWRNAAPLIPARASEKEDGGVVSGSDSASAFAGLLRRNIPPSQLLHLCVAEWKRSFGHRESPGKIQRIDDAAINGSQQPVHAFQQITQILHEKK